MKRVFPALAGAALLAAGALLAGCGGDPVRPTPPPAPTVVPQAKPVKIGIALGGGAATTFGAPPMFATLAGLPGCAPLAERALAGLTGQLRDAEHGGWSTIRDFLVQRLPRLTAAQIDRQLSEGRFVDQLSWVTRARARGSACSTSFPGW